MDSMDLRDRLTAYVAAEPPRRLTADVVLRAGRRARRRQWLAAGSAVAVLVAGAVLVPSLYLRTGMDAPEAGLSADAACAAAAAPTPPPAPRSPGRSYDPAPGERTLTETEIDRMAARLSCVVIGLVAERMPGFSFYPAEETWLPPGLGPLQFSVEGDEPVFVASAIVEDGDGIGSIGFTVSRRGYLLSPFGYRQSLACPSSLCTERSGPRGEPVEVVVWEGQYFVQVYLGQTVVNAVALHYDTRYDSADPPRVDPDHVATARAGLRPPLAIEQLIEIATDPRLDVFAAG